MDKQRAWDVNKTYELLINWENNPNNISIILEDNSYDGISFLTTDTNTNNSMRLREGGPQFVHGAGSRGIGGRGGRMRCR